MEAWKEGKGPGSLAERPHIGGSVEALPMPAGGEQSSADFSATVAQLEAAARQAARGNGVERDPLVHAAESVLAPPVVQVFYQGISPDRQQLMKSQGEKIAADLATAMHAVNERAILAHQQTIARWLTKAGANKAFAEQHAKIVVEELRGRRSDV